MHDRRRHQRKCCYSNLKSGGTSQRLAHDAPDPHHEACAATNQAKMTSQPPSCSSGEVWHAAAPHLCGSLD